MNIFETATRRAFRFPSVRGQLTTEQLWSLPLTATNGFALDDVAKAVNAELKDVTEESFVSTERDPAQTLLETKLAVVKHVIAVKLAEREAARTAAVKKAEKQKLLAALERKQDAELEGLSQQELLARIEAL